jgi:hypothetical protein
LIKGVAILLATVGVCLPQCALAAQPVQSPHVIDVALSDGGVMLGQVVDTSGVPKSRVPVALHSGQQQVGVAKTDANGYFAFSGLRGGVYQVVAAEGHGAYRAWTPGTAPPTAQQGALVVAGEDLTRGQCGRLGCWLSNPWVLAGIIAVAIAVPVGIAAADDDDEFIPRPATPGGTGL